MTPPIPLTNRDIERLTRMRERVRAIYPVPSTRYSDHLTACWLAFWNWLDVRSMAGELRMVQTYCPCGFSVEECPCSLDVPERIAHEVTV